MHSNRCRTLLDSPRLGTIDADHWIDRVEELLWSIDGVAPQPRRDGSEVLVEAGSVPRDLAARVIDAAMSRWSDVDSMACRCDLPAEDAVEGDLLLELADGGRLVASFRVSGGAPPAVRGVWIDE